MQPRTRMSDIAWMSFIAWLNTSRELRKEDRAITDEKD
jgi:hypothetical protein